MAPARVAKAAPNSYTILNHNTTLATARTLFPDLEFNPLTDFDCIGLVNFASSVLTARIDLPSRSFEEFLAHVRSATAAARSSWSLCYSQAIGKPIRRRSRHILPVGRKPAVEPAPNRANALYVHFPPLRTARDGGDRRGWVVNRADFREVNVTRHLVPPETEVLLHTGSGGGWGDPLERDPARVQWNVIERLVSGESARDDYGVVLRDDFSIEENATQALCRKLAQEAA